MHIMEYRILWIRYSNKKIRIFSNIWIRNSFGWDKREKIAKSAKQMVSISFAVALFVLLSKRKKEKLNKLTALRSDVTS